MENQQMGLLEEVRGGPRPAKISSPLLHIEAHDPSLVHGTGETTMGPIEAYWWETRFVWSEKPKVSCANFYPFYTWHHIPKVPSKTNSFVYHKVWKGIWFWVPKSLRKNNSRVVVVPQKVPEVALTHSRQNEWLVFRGINLSILQIILS